jgi:hypothetical protein
MKSLDEVFAPALDLGETLLEVAVAVSLSHAYYLVGLTDRRLLLLGVKSARDLTIIDWQELPRDGTAEISFSSSPGNIKLSSPRLAMPLQFPQPLLDGNQGRARSMGEALGSFEASPAEPESSRYPLDVVPFEGLRRLRVMRTVVLPILVCVMVVVALLFWRGFGGVGGACKSDGDCGGHLYCKRGFHDTGVCAEF